MEQSPTQPMPRIPLQSASKESLLARFRKTWGPACRQVIPLYVAIQLVLALVSIYAGSVLIHPQSSTWGANSLSILWKLWLRWDTVHYFTLVQQGYPAQYASDIAFFPLFPLLVRGMALVYSNILIDGLLISRVAGLVLLLVLYQLAKEELGEKVASYVLIGLCLFPTALFLWAAYPESLYLALIASSFYAMRHRAWWLAGLCGLFASMARPNGILLLLPFCFEYLRQIHFNWRNVRWNILSVLLVPTGLLLFALFCYQRYGDALAFAHAQSFWNRVWTWPWMGPYLALHKALVPFSLTALCMLTLDLVPNLLALVLIACTFLHRNKLGERHWTYVLYAIALWLFSACSITGYKPLLGAGRNMLAILPLYLILGVLAERSRWFRMLYFPLSGALCLFWLILFLTGYIVD